MKVGWNMFFCLLLGAGLALGVVRMCRRPAVPERIVEVRRDTVWRTDTMRVETPAPFKVQTIDTIYVKADTLIRHDTIYVKLPKEVKYYKDSSYTARVSGFEPSLDWIEIHQRTPQVYIETRKAPPRKPVGIGAALGPAIVVDPDGNVYGGLGVTLGLTLNF